MTKKSKSTAVVKYTDEEQQYLDTIRQENNVVEQKEFSGPNRLVINTASKDANGTKRPIGAWHITNTDVYVDGPINFRPIRKVNKLIRYSPDDNKDWKIVGETVYFNNIYSDPSYDTLGGERLGRLFGQATNGMSDDEKELNRKKGEFYMDIFGLVTVDGSDEEYPVLYRVRGYKIRKMSDAFNSIPNGQDPNLYSYKLETEQPEGKTWWDLLVTPDLSEVLPVAPILQYNKEIEDFIQGHNEYVSERWKANRKNTVENEIVANAQVIEAEIVTDDDELPF